jgi:hypothetical protein
MLQKALGVSVNIINSKIRIFSFFIYFRKEQEYSVVCKDALHNLSLFASNFYAGLFTT